MKDACDLRVFLAIRKANGLMQYLADAEEGDTWSCDSLKLHSLSYLMSRRGLIEQHEWCVYEVDPEYLSNPENLNTKNNTALPKLSTVSESGQMFLGIPLLGIVKWSELKARFNELHNIDA